MWLCRAVYVHVYVRLGIQNAKRAPYSHHPRCTRTNIYPHADTYMCSLLASCYTQTPAPPHEHVCVSPWAQTHLPLSMVGRPPCDPSSPVAPPPPFTSPLHLPIGAVPSKPLLSDSPGLPSSTASGSGPGKALIWDCISRGRNEARWYDLSTRHLTSGQSQPPPSWSHPPFLLQREWSTWQ